MPKGSKRGNGRRRGLPSGSQAIVCSACLMGVPCRYDGRSRPESRLLAVAARRVCVPVCPEQLGGLPTPRDAAERRGRRVVTASGRDLTAAFDKGARAALNAARLAGARVAVLKRGSPSCGSGWIYDGTFTGRRKRGDGVTAALFKAAGLRVLTEEDL